MPGGHGEYLAGIYGEGGRVLTPAASPPPDTLAPFLREQVIAGDGFDRLPDLPGVPVPQLPDARTFALLDRDSWCAAEARYARPPDAKLPGGILP